MIWIFLLGISLAFVFPIISNFTNDRKLYYLFYILHILFAVVFYFVNYVKFGLVSGFDGSFIDYNLRNHRCFFALSVLAYNFFLISFLSVYWPDRWTIRLLIIKISLIVSVQLLIFVRYNVFGISDNANLIVVGLSIINFFLICSIIYRLFKSGNSLMYRLAYVIIIVTIGQVLGIFFDETSTNMFSVKFPYLITQLIFICELILFNYILTHTHYSKQDLMVEKENRLLLESNQLKKSALQAQMNPHFVFNCLNSIQNFIVSNDKESAMEYLATFAKLIRQNLENSTKESVLLHEEITMLENYLELEKMRFNSIFDYSINVDRNIDLFDVYVPTLLIQPFVENAIIHGMKAKKSGGKIILDIDKIDDVMKITISDNGPGINFKTNKNKRFKSLGTSLTNKRIAFINQEQDKKYSLNTSSDVNGTEVTIQILNVFK